MTDQRWVIDTEPSQRWPVYTRLNANDVLSDPITPLGASLAWIPNIIPGWGAGYCASGTFTLAEMSVDVPPAGGFFYGYLYVNMTIPRVGGVRAGIGADTIDAMWFGNHPERPAHVPHENDDDPAATERMNEKNAWALSTATYPELDEERAIADRLRSERPDLSVLSPLALVARAREVMPLERLTWRGEVVATQNAALGPGVLAQLLGPEHTGLTVGLVGQAGDVDSAAPSFALWDLSRLVRGDEALGAAFDAGLDGLAARLPATSPSFAARFGAFLADFGYRGPNEWDLGSDTWETRPELVLGLLDRLRQLDEDAGPAARTAEQAGQSEQALAQALAVVGTDPTAVATLHAAIASARRFGAWRERAKTNCIKVLHEGRVPLVELGRRLHTEGHLDHPQQVFMALDSELDALALEPATMTATLREREQQWRGLFGLELPTFLDGAQPIPPLSSLKRITESAVDAVKAGDVLQGIGASAGVARGRARVILDVGELAAFEPGEILVAPQTDPSWTPLFMVSAAAVVDVGSVGSHAMIVSRELGIPCAAGVTAASRRIPDGALLEVDGSAGTVTVLEG